MKNFKKTVRAALTLMMCLLFFPPFTYQAKGCGIIIRRNVQTGRAIANESGKPEVTVYSDRKEDEADSSDKEPSDDKIICSACIADLNGTTYILDEYGSRGLGLTPIPFRNAMYDYVSSFAFYNGKVYYCCKEAGTSDYKMALYESNPDGSKQTRLYAPDEEWTYLHVFAIKGGEMYFADSPIYDISQKKIRWHVIDLGDHTVREVPDVPEDIKPSLLTSGRSWQFNGKSYFADNGRIIARNGDGSEEAVFTDSPGYSYLNIEAVIGSEGSDSPCIYYSNYESGSMKFNLYRYYTDTGRNELIGRRIAAGGGGYFNW